MSPTTPPAEHARQVSLGALLAVFWLSGAAALIYEVLWLKQLGRLFGVTAYASATTLAVFFLGLSLGSLAFGRRAEKSARPLRVYAALELGIALSALLYFGLFAAFSALQQPLFGGEVYRPGAALALKFLLSAGILLLPTFMMGGTLPVMAQYLVRSRDELGARATLLYTFNTLGAVVGALLSGFLLPRLLGFRGAYAVAIAINLSIALVTWWWSRTREAPAPVATDDTPPPGEESGLGVQAIRRIAALSGGATLALEVLWTRMAAQVLQNSVYTFSIILSTFLLSLAIGAAVAHRLVRRARSPRRVLEVLLLWSGVLVVLTPFAFQALAGGLEFWDSERGFWSYIGISFAGLFVILAPAVVVMGAVFPFLMRLGERTMVSAGRTVGELASINTAVAIAGSLAAGFVLLEYVGLWASIWLVGAVYLVAAILLARSTKARVVPAAAAVVAVVLAVTVDFDVLRLEAAAGSEETIVESWEGPDGTVAVTRHGEGDLRLRVNSSYNLGTSASAPNERLQGQVPFLLHPTAESAFFLGLGTGISASGAMQFPLRRIVVCEVNPDVVRASREYFGPWLRGLFDDPRVTVIPEDGVLWLSAHPEKYDVVVADIFLSFKAGVGSLYTLEHFRTVSDRLQPGGIFVQWIPVFDTSVPEFEILARTMLEAFDQVTLWRRSFSPVFPVYALVGSNGPSPLDPARLERGLAALRSDPDLDERTWILHLPLAAYVANLTALAERFAEAPLNTDDRTWLEYTAPITERDSKGSGMTRVLAWAPLLEYCEELQAALPPDEDPFLAQVAATDRDQVLAGTAYYGYEVMRRLGDEAAARHYLARYEELVGDPDE